MLDVQKTKHQTVKVEGVNLFYREAGRRDAPGVLLLHGQPSSSYSFRDVISPLAEVARVVAPDLPGFGFTEAPDDYEYTFEVMARAIDSLTSRHRAPTLMSSLPRAALSRASRSSRSTGPSRSARFSSEGVVGSDCRMPSSGIRRGPLHAAGHAQHAGFRQQLSLRARTLAL